MNMSTSDLKLVYADEIGERLAGFTVRSASGVELCKTTEELEAIGGTAWASSVELLIWLSRSPGFWGDFATSARFKVWDQQSRKVIEVTVPRKGCEQPFSREDLS